VGPGRCRDTCRGPVAHAPTRVLGARPQPPVVAFARCGRRHRRGRLGGGCRALGQCQSFVIEEAYITVQWCSPALCCVRATPLQARVSKTHARLLAKKKKKVHLVPPQTNFCCLLVYTARAPGRVHRRQRRFPGVCPAPHVRRQQGKRVTHPRRVGARSTRTGTSSSVPRHVACKFCPRGQDGSPTQGPAWHAL
jgi:hypothetical protein